MNMLRGECSIKLNGEDVLIKINNNALFIVSKLTGLKLSDLFQQLASQDLDSMLNFMHQFVKAGYLNGLAYKGIENKYKNDTLDALIGDVSDEDMQKVFDIFNKSVSIAPSEAALGNGMAPEVSA